MGYVTDSRVFWLDEKVLQLRDMLDEWISQTRVRHPDEIAKLLGDIWNGMSQSSGVANPSPSSLLTSSCLTKG